MSTTLTMVAFTQTARNFMSILPLYGRYQNIGDQSTPLYQQSPPVPYYQQSPHAPQYEQFPPALYSQQSPPTPHYEQPTAYDSKVPNHEVKPLQSSSSASKPRGTFSKLRRLLSVVMFMANICSAILAGLMFAAMAYMTVKYLTTRNDTAYGKNDELLGPWSPDTKAWPTYMLLAAGAVTFVGTIVALFTSCVSSRTEMRFKAVFYLIQIAFWIVIAVMYRVGKTGKDLWGWSCMMEGGQREKLFHDILNFEHMCNLQVRSFRMSGYGRIL